MSITKYRDNSLFGPFFTTRFMSPFDDDDFFGDLQGKNLNIEETEDKVTVSAPVYGVEPSDVEVFVRGNVLTIKGEAKQKDTKKQGKKVVYKSSMQTSFNYSTTLPSMVVGSKAKAKVKNGVVTIEVPKSEEEKSKRVQIDVE